MNSQEKIITISAKSASSFFYIVGIVILIITTFFFLGRVNTLKQSSTANAVITEVSHYRTCRPNAGCGTQSRIILNFKTNLGEDTKVSGNFGHFYNLGDTVKILYSIKNPQIFFIESFNNLWGIYIFWYFFGATSFLLAIFISVKGKNKSN